MHLLYVRKHLAHLLGHRERVFKHHLLRQIAYGNTVGNHNVAASRLLQPCYDLEHGAFTSTVLAHKGYLVLGVYYVVYIIEKQLRAEFY